MGQRNINNAAKVFEYLSNTIPIPLRYLPKGIAKPLEEFSVAKPGSTIIQWEDFEGFFYLETSSEKLVQTLLASGIRWVHRDGEAGLYYFRLPTAWLRLRTPRGLLRLGWYPTRKRKGCPALYEERPKLTLVK